MINQHSSYHPYNEITPSVIMFPWAIIAPAASRRLICQSLQMSPLLHQFGNQEIAKLLYPFIIRPVNSICRSIIALKLLDSERYVKALFISVSIPFVSDIVAILKSSNLRLVCDSRKFNCQLSILLRIEHYCFYRSCSLSNQCFICKSIT